MTPSHSGKIALALSLGGVLLAVVCGLTIGRAQSGVMIAYLVFIAFQIAAFMLGIGARKDSMGKAACFTSATLACGSLLVLA